MGVVIYYIITSLKKIFVPRYQEEQQYFSVKDRAGSKWPPVHVHVRYRSISQKNKAEEFKRITNYFLCYSNAKSTLLVLLTFNKVKKPNHQTFDFVYLLLFLLSFFLSSSPGITQKSIRCMRILNIPNNCSANLLHSYLF